MCGQAQRVNDSYSLTALPSVKESLPHKYYPDILKRILSHSTALPWKKAAFVNDLKIGLSEHLRAEMVTDVQYHWECCEGNPIKTTTERRFAVP